MERAKAIVAQAHELPEEAREAFLREACAGDPALAQRVQGMLSSGGSSLGERLERLRAELASRYEVLEEAGSGGMAVVFRARDLKHGRTVALKVLRPEVAAAIGVPRFLREIRIAANLQHPNVLPLFDSGEADGLPFYVMPFVDGPTLKERIEREGPLEVGEAFAIAREIADALDHAHDQGLVHGLA